MGISTVRRPLVMMLVVAAIAGCASPPPAPQPVVNRPDPAALALDAAARRPMPEHTRSEAAAPVQAVLNGPVITIDSYRGDAAALLERLAKANGKGFAVLGTQPRLPLFVHVDVRAQPLKAVLSDISLQFGGRADVVLTDTDIQIVYKREKTL